MARRRDTKLNDVAGPDPSRPAAAKRLEQIEIQPESALDDRADAPTDLHVEDKVIGTDPGSVA